MPLFNGETVCISDIKICCKVSNETSISVHKNRMSHGVVFYLSGESLFKVIGEKSYVVEAGQVIYLPKYSNYTTQDSEDAVCIAVNFDLSATDDFFPTVLLSKRYSEKYALKFNKILRLWNEQDTAYKNGCMSVLYDIIFNMQRDAQHEYISSSRAKIVEDALYYIDTNIKDEQLTVACVAKKFNITPEYLRILFKAFKSVSPKEYIMMKRMEMARIYVEANEIKLNYIPTECGFGDYPYFSKCFKRYFGVSPNQYRNHIQSEKGGG